MSKIAKERSMIENEYLRAFLPVQDYYNFIMNVEQRLNIKD
jgi:hypothetical protein